MRKETLMYLWKRPGMKAKGFQDLRKYRSSYPSRIHPPLPHLSVYHFASTPWLSVLMISNDKVHVKYEDKTSYSSVSLFFQETPTKDKDKKIGKTKKSNSLKPPTKSPSTSYTGKTTAARKCRGLQSPWSMVNLKGLLISMMLDDAREIHSFFPNWIFLDNLRNEVCFRNIEVNFSLFSCTCWWMWIFITVGMHN